MQHVFQGSPVLFTWNANPMAAEGRTDSDVYSFEKVERLRLTETAVRTRCPHISAKLRNKCQR
jgi:hypothetical protein